MKIEYGVNGFSPEFSFDTNWCIEEDLSYIAEDAAEDYQENHDGWESAFPIEISLYYEGDFLGDFEVTREYTPTFLATEATWRDT